MHKKNSRTFLAVRCRELRQYPVPFSLLGSHRWVLAALQLRMVGGHRAAEVQSADFRPTTTIIKNSSRWPDCWAETGDTVTYSRAHLLPSTFVSGLFMCSLNVIAEEGLTRCCGHRPVLQTGSNKQQTECFTSKAWTQIEFQASSSQSHLKILKFKLNLVGVRLPRQ